MPRLSGDKRKRLEELWLEGGMSVRRMAIEVGCSRRAAEREVGRLARELHRAMPDDLTFEARWREGWTMRLEAISATIARYERELKLLEAKRKEYQGEDEFIGAWTSISSLILANRRETDALRAEHAATVAMLPPRQLLLLELEEARGQLLATTEARMRRVEHK